ncbi:hypothetical protein HMPREF9446_02795 [Bacteroides fluxus YIT 12057]|uniref:Uncharacterized protein n=1 Tax=Bacteroides fluxus YIT 12057 TaxID=763034 RepID=F3PVL7_9BACE|nr:hypothetical protein HMPREF9446_02795 [Bacteroides fluxus YIT 12057]
MDESVGGIIVWSDAICFVGKCLLETFKQAAGKTSGVRTKKWQS